MEQNLISNPGDSLFLSILDQPIVCIKQRDYTIKTFFNICRHRAGSFKEKKNNNSLVCTYHGWTYSINGKLKSPKGFSKSDNYIKNLCLKKVKLRFGKVLFLLIFVVMQIILKHYFITLKKLAPYDLVNFTFNRKVSYKIKSNWKVYLDNFLEGLHIPVAHPRLNKVINYKFTTQNFITIFQSNLVK